MKSRRFIGATLPAQPAPPDPPCDHWLPVHGCPPPMNATWIVGQMPDGGALRVHWADGGGEEQPRYRGWFRQAGANNNFQVDDPVAWRPETGACARCGAPLVSMPAPPEPGREGVR
jgi:hypothetical protein